MHMAMAVMRSAFNIVVCFYRNRAVLVKPMEVGVALTHEDCPHGSLEFPARVPMIAVESL
jgi:hypothetical protein